CKSDTSFSIAFFSGFVFDLTQNTVITTETITSRKISMLLRLKIGFLCFSLKQLPPLILYCSCKCNGMISVYQGFKAAVKSIFAYAIHSYATHLDNLSFIFCWFIIFPIF